MVAIPRHALRLARDMRILANTVDSLYMSFDIEVSEDIFMRCLSEQMRARQLRDERRAVYCSEWLNAEVSPSGANGYPLLMQTRDWAIRLERENPTRPPIYVEMRSYILHTHSGGVIGALEDTCTYIRRVLLADQSEVAEHTITLQQARMSRLDLHLDWQGGWHPTLAEGEVRQFLKPGKAKWQPHLQGNDCTGYDFGKNRVVARIYNKSAEMRDHANDWYQAYLHERNPETFNPDEDVWRIEFEMKREGTQGFSLEATPEESDTDAEIAAEIAGEDLPTVGTVKKALHHAPTMWGYLTEHWLRLTLPTATKNRARWPIHPAWGVLQHGFHPIEGAEQLDEGKLKLVRSRQFSGYSRGMKRMALGIVSTAELMLDTDPELLYPGFLAYMQRIAVLAAEKQRERLARLEAMGIAPTPSHLRTLRYNEYVQHLTQMGLGVFASAGVIGEELPPFEQVGDVLEYLCDDLEEVAQKKGGMPQLMHDKRSKIYKVAVPKDAFKRKHCEEETAS